MASTSGDLVEKASSTVSSPTVHYSVAYTAARADDASERVSVRLTVGTWLHSSGSRLGTGIQLTCFARIDGGAWQSVVLKNSTESWSGTARHEAGLTLSVSSVGGTATIEWYVSRVGSRYSGTAGVLGSAGSPLSGRAMLPAYTARASNTSAGSATSGVGSAETVASADRAVWLKVGGVWKKAVPYVKVGGVWKKAVPYVRVNGAWKAT